MKIKINKQAGFYSFPDIPEWFLWVCIGIFGIGLLTIFVIVGAAINWLLTHIRFV